LFVVYLHSSILDEEITLWRDLICWYKQLQVLSPRKLGPKLLTQLAKEATIYPVISTWSTKTDV